MVAAINQENVRSGVWIKKMAAIKTQKNKARSKEFI
jgi:hypothetical protein